MQGPPPALLTVEVQRSRFAASVTASGNVAAHCDYSIALHLAAGRAGSFCVPCYGVGLRFLHAVSLA